jgi:hypothetical protein
MVRSALLANSRAVTDCVNGGKTTGVHARIRPECSSRLCVTTDGQDQSQPSQ